MLMKILSISQLTFQTTIVWKKSLTRSGPFCFEPLFSWSIGLLWLLCSCWLLGVWYFFAIFTGFKSQYFLVFNFSTKNFPTLFFLFQKLIGMPCFSYVEENKVMPWHPQGFCFQIPHKCWNPWVIEFADWPTYTLQLHSARGCFDAQHLKISAGGM